MFSIPDQALLELAHVHGTPLYVYDGDAMERQAKSLQAIFNGFELLFSYKANPLKEVCEILATCGIGAEVGSLAELDIAINCHIPGSRLTFSGPGKTQRELQHAMHAHAAIDLESAQEIELASQVASENGITSPVTLRINTKHRPATAGELMGGGPSQFGIDEEVVSHTWRCINPSHLKLTGFHAHVASQVFDAKAIVSHVQRMLELSRTLAHELNIKLCTVNFGGGIGIPYSGQDQPLDLNQLARDCYSLASGQMRSSGNQIRLQFEFGRLFVAPHGVYLATVSDVKKSRGTNFAVVDAGIAGLSRPAMPWAQPHKMRVINSDSKEVERYTIVGRSCLPADVLSPSVYLPVLDRGNIVLAENAGAYGPTMTMERWGSHSQISEVVVYKGNSILCYVKSPGRSSRGT